MKGMTNNMYVPFNMRDDTDDMCLSEGEMID